MNCSTRFLSRGDKNAISYDEGGSTRKQPYILQQYLWEIFTIIIAIVSLIMAMRDSNKMFFGLLVCCNGREKKLCKVEGGKKRSEEVVCSSEKTTSTATVDRRPISPSRVINNVSLAYRPYNFHKAEVRLEHFSLQVPIRPQAVFV
jgi:hypothetical protein